MNNEEDNKKATGYFARCEIWQNPIFQMLPIVFIALIAGDFLPLISACHRTGSSDEVVIYTSQDEEYADPIFHDFQKQTGIAVKPFYDSEAVKTVGLVNRLLAENDHPQCDVFWNNEEL